jgi:hypothetical protein
MFNLNLIFGNKYLKEKPAEGFTDVEPSSASSGSEQVENCCTTQETDMCSPKE